MQRKVSVVEDLKGNKIVFIHDIRFKGRNAEDGKMCLYDIMNIKKRNGYPFPVIKTLLSQKLVSS